MNMMIKNPYKSFIYVFILLWAASYMQSCSNAKYVPEGDYLYMDGQVKIDSDTIPEQYIKPLTDELESLLRPKPNSQFLGMMPRVYLYNIIDTPKKENSIKGWLKYKVGSEPVFLSDVNREYNENLLRNRLENLGFFQAHVTSDTLINKHKAKVVYTSTPGIVYRIQKVVFEMDSTELGKDILSSQHESLLQVGRPFNLSTIITERERIDNELKNKGYYYFSPDYLLVEVDSSRMENSVDLYVTIKPETPVKAKQKYYINNIYINPNYQGNAVGDFRRNSRQIENYKNQYYFIDPENTFRKFALAKVMFFNKGDIYNRNSHSQTLNQLVNMGTFKFVKNDFVDADTGKNLLDVHYQLTPLPKRGLRIEILGKTASIYNGSELTVNWLNRNIFKSGELLTVSAFGGFEVQRGGNVNLNSSYNRYGAEVSLSFPRLIAPFTWEPTRRYVPRTIVRAGYEFLDRKDSYTLNSLRFSYDYLWRESIEKEHDLSLLEVTFVQARNITESFQEQLEINPTLRHTVTPQFTFGPNYNFIYTNTMKDLTHTFYFKGGLDLSANVYGLIKGSSYKTGNVHKIFNTEFSQYVKLEGDIRHYYKLSENQTLASRFVAGFGYSYGNSRTLPYVKQFYSGGPNSLKGFRARAVGPGSYSPPLITENTYFVDQTGDIKLEINTELRSKLFSIVHGAIFLDAGNVWLQNPDPNKPNAEFSEDFYKEIAVSGGIGFRFDLSFLVLRTDFGMPLRIPSLPENERWVFDKIDFGSRTWRNNNLIFSLAIGYPF